MEEVLGSQVTVDAAAALILCDVFICISACIHCLYMYLRAYMNATKRVNFAVAESHDGNITSQQKAMTGPSPHNRKP
jgi:hypothetical protein